VSYRPPACLRTAETPLHAATLVSALTGAHFTHWRQPRVQDRRTFGAEVAILDWGRHASSDTLPAPLRAPDAMSLAGGAPFLVLANLRRRSTANRAFGAEGRRRHAGSSLHSKNSHGISGISVSLAPVQRKLPRETKTVPRPKVAGVAERG
jgi:hypothetical protein